jgi:hypothetical protein
MGTMPKGTEQRLTCALGNAVVRLWSYLPPSVQHDLFEEAIAAHGKTMRPQLAQFLHEHHIRTVDLNARNPLEPDSLGG